MKTEQLNISFDSSAEMTFSETEILRLIQRGKANAIKAPFLSASTGLQGVEVRRIIRHLVMDHDVLIGSCSRGFYYAETPDETDEVYRSMRHRGISILMRAAKLQKISLDEVYGQARLEFTEVEK